ncbi:5-carboxymethyl-2-hydroxymuconate Delta-isomerase [Kordiimonas gwangyangensis]|uniref:5-carboxymethyl-2-hydroxymuconate Delta-isomerase n=1 Tax=Kordiimonas gwangyangensis TaxID=288022 RepID=UPI00036D7A31|nr:5-carboxymethyl-2-hydroxymuconate Delta-isomerase [Kordiimonas gwangyangensis]
MPHLVIEYSDADFDAKAVEQMMLAAHKGALASGLFGEDDIKTRAYACSHGLVGGKPGSFIHVTVYLLSGRDHATQKLLANTLLDHMTAAGFAPHSLSVDCRDMDRAVYSKITR